MSNSEKKISIKEKILRDITEGNVTMRSKLYFTLKVIVLMLMAVTVVSVSVFIFNFILFSIEINSHDALLGFGLSGWRTFLRFFPWGLLIIDIVLVIGLEWLIRQFRFGNKIPVLYLLSGLLILTICAGIVLDLTSFNDRFSQRGGRGLPPPFGNLYSDAHRMPPRGSGICQCTILSISKNTLVVADTREGGKTLTVLLPEDTPLDVTKHLMVGDTVFIAGEEKDGVIHAFGVRKEPPGGPRPGSRPQRGIR